MQHEEHEVSSSEDEQSVQGEDEQSVQGSNDTLQEHEVSPGGDGQPAQGVILKTLGILTIIFGIAIGIYMIVQFSRPAASMLFSESSAELTFGEVVIAIGVSLLFVVPGALCIGVGKVLALLEKDSA